MYRCIVYCCVMIYDNADGMLAIHLLNPQGLAPALVMVLNPTIQYILYEWLTARIREMRRQAQKAGTRQVPQPAHRTKLHCHTFPRCHRTIPSTQCMLVCMVGLGAS